MATSHHSLSPAEREVLDRISHQPGFFELATGLFRDGGAWATLLMMIAEIGLFAGGAYCGWRFAQSTAVLEALHWGLPSLGMILMSFSIKFSFWPVMHIQRLKRQVAELELTVARQSR